MSYDPDNIFARILRGEIPCRKVYEDDFTLAFHDIHPQAPIHVLVIPKGSYQNMADFATQASAEVMAAFLRSVGLVAKNLGLEDMGYRIIVNNGVNGGQEVPHLHFHILGGKNLGTMLVKHT